MHGGDIYRNNIRLDFSVNVNPFGIPSQVKDALYDAVEAAVNYPDIKSEGLSRKLSDKLGIEKDCLLMGNGASEILLALLLYLRPLRVIIPMPSFSGYERAARSCGAKVETYYLKEKSMFAIDEGILDFLERLDKGDVLFLANPNNPTGKLTEKKLIRQIVEKALKKGVEVILDECFITMTPRSEEYSMLDLFEEYPNVVIVRSFTKIYAIPGVRLGYMICSDKELCRGVASMLPEWNISVFAQYAGEKALDCDEYIKESLSIISEERTWLQERLKGFGFTVIDSDADFIMFRTDMPLYDMLLEKEILIRDCSDYTGIEDGWYRISVKKHADNLELCRNIEELIHGA